MTDSTDIEALRQLIDEVAPLPWRASFVATRDGTGTVPALFDGYGCTGERPIPGLHFGTVDTDVRARFIVAAVNALPALLDELAAARAEHETDVAALTEIIRLHGIAAREIAATGAASRLSERSERSELTRLSVDLAYQNECRQKAEAERDVVLAALSAARVQIATSEENAANREMDLRDNHRARIAEVIDELAAARADSERNRSLWERAQASLRREGMGAVMAERDEKTADASARDAAFSTFVSAQVAHGWKLAEKAEQERNAAFSTLVSAQVAMTDANECAGWPPLPLADAIRRLGEERRRVQNALVDATLVLRNLEWSGFGFDGCNACPVCKSEHYPIATTGGGGKHAPGCALAALIGAL